MLLISLISEREKFNWSDTSNLGAFVRERLLYAGVDFVNGPSQALHKVCILFEV